MGKKATWNEIECESNLEIQKQKEQKEKMLKWWLCFYNYFIGGNNIQLNEQIVTYCVLYIQYRFSLSLPTVHYFNPTKWWRTFTRYGVSVLRFRILKDTWKYLKCNRLVALTTNILLFNQHNMQYVSTWEFGNS